MAVDVQDDPYANDIAASAAEAAAAPPKEEESLLRAYIGVMAVLAVLLAISTVVMWRLLDREKESYEASRSRLADMQRDKAIIETVQKYRRKAGGRQFEENKFQLQNLIVPLARSKHGITIASAGGIKNQTERRGKTTFVDNGVTFRINRVERDRLAAFLYDVEASYPFLRVKTLDMQRKNQGDKELWNVTRLQIVYRAKAPRRKKNRKK